MIDRTNDEFSGFVEEVHECVVCRGRFSDEELLRTHVCPMAQEGTIELSEEPGKLSFPFGIDQMGVVSALTDISAGIVDGSILPQRLTTSVTQEHDFEMKTVSITYAERR